MFGALKGALSELLRHPVRTLLICQGILWSVTLMVAPAAILEGSRTAAIERSSELGTDRIQIESDAGADRSIETEDVKDLREKILEADPDSFVSGISAADALFNGEKKMRGWVLYSDAEELAARSLKMLVGRWFESGSQPPEVVVEENLVEVLLGSTGLPEGLIGKELWISQQRFGFVRVGLKSSSEDSTPFIVSGVVAKPKGVDPLGFGKDHTFSDMVEGVLKMLGVAPDSAPWLDEGLSVHIDRDASAKLDREVDWTVVSTNPSRITEIGALVEESLIRRGCSPLIYSNAAWAVLASPELDGYLVLHDVFFLISALTGLVVLANLLLLTGRRRRAEVGLRRAEGATRIDIFSQFFFEGLLIALLGALLGAAVGVGLAEIRVRIDPSELLEVVWPWWTIMKSALLVTAGAALASAGPAWTVRGVDPALLLSERR